MESNSAKKIKKIIELVKERKKVFAELNILDNYKKTIDNIRKKYGKRRKNI